MEVRVGRLKESSPRSMDPLTGSGAWRGALRRSLRSPSFAFLVVCVAGLAGRLIYLAEVYGSPDFNSLVLDAQWYHLEAVRIRAEGWFPPDAFFRAPGYPYLLALIYGLGGNDLLPARVLQIALASLSSGLALLLGWRIYGRAVGWVAGILAATYGVFIYFSVEILGTALVVATSLLSLVLLARAESGRGWGSWFLAGLAIGVSAVVRPTILIFGALAVLWAKGLGSRRCGWGRAAAVAVGIAVWLAPVTIVNYAASGEFVLVAHQGGVNYYIGNNPQSDGKTAAGPGPGDSDLLRSPHQTQDSVYRGAKMVADRASGRDLTPPEVSRFWFGEALRFIREHPGDWFRLQGRKLYYFWNGYVIDNNRDIGAFIEANSPSLRLPHPGFWLVGPLGLVGLVLSFRRGRSSRLLGWFVIAQMVSVVAFFVCERFRMPAAMALTVLAALGAVSLVESFRKREWTTFVPLMLAVIGLSWVVNTRALGIEKDRDVPVHLSNQAAAYMEQGLYEEAIDTYRRVLELNPLDAKAHYTLGTAYLAGGRYDRATSAYRKATALDGSLAAPVHNDLGVYHLLAGRLDQAEEELLAALETEPEYVVANFNLAQVYRRTGRRALALETYTRILDIRDVHPAQKSVALAELAHASAAEGKIREAGELIDRALEFNPDNDRARLYRGDILRRSGDRAGAILEWQRLVEESLNPAVKAEAEARLAEP